jgi:G3E family GTPase
LRGDLIDGLHDILRRRDSGELAPFARVILETSGLADPAPILHALLADPALARRTRIAGVTTLVDAVNGQATLRAHGEARRQVALADILALTKCDLVADPDELRALRAALQAINPTAPILDVAGGEFALADFLAENRISAAPRRASAMSVHGGGAVARSFSSDEPIAAAALDRFLSRLETMLGPGLLRVKGLAATREFPDAPLLIQGAQHILHPPRLLSAWPDDERRTRLVVITEGVDPEAIESLWRALTGIPEIDRPDLAALTDNPLAPRRGGLLG